MQTTRRLRIEPLNETHAAALLPVLHDERIYPYIPDRRCDRVEDLAARYRRLAAGSGDPAEQWLNWALFRQTDGQAIGVLQSTVSVNERLADVAYVLSPAHWGNGYATEALAWLLQHLAARGTLDTARAQIDERNTASLAVVRRLGFAHVRTVQEETSTDEVHQRSLVNLTLPPGWDAPARPAA